MANQTWRSTANNASEISILLGQGHGTFNGPTASAIAGPSFAMAAGDFNGDGKLDLAVASIQGPSRFCSETARAGSQPASTPSGGATLCAICAGDFNGDDKL